MAIASTAFPALCHCSSIVCNTFNIDATDLNLFSLKDLSSLYEIHPVCGLLKRSAYNS
jgi:hypothetical protein